MRDISDTERLLLNGYQRDFPLIPHPFREIGDTLGMSEGEVLSSIEGLQHEEVVTRLGAVVRPNSAGASTLAAMAVPQQRLEAVADFVSARPEVNHNYEREHDLNLWFVVTAPCGDGVLAVLTEIEVETGIAVVDLPLETQYHIDLGFEL